MADAFQGNLTVKGVPELSHALEQLDKAARAEALAHAAAEGALVIRDAVHVPVGPGKRGKHLSQDLTIKITVKEDSHVEAAVGFFGKTVARLVEFGHLLVKGGTLRGGRRKKTKGGKTTQGHVVGHVPAHPFLRPAFDSSQPAALEAMRRALWSDLTAAAGAK